MTITPATIADLYRQAGPHLCVYLPLVDADGVPIERAAGELADALITDGAPRELALTAAKAATTPMVDAGGVAVFVASGQDTVVVPLPEAPVAPAVSVGDVPFASPVVEWLQRSVTHAVVELGATSTDVTIFPSFEDAWSTSLQPMTATAEAVVANQLGELLVQHRAQLVLLVGPPAWLSPGGARLAAALPPTVRVAPIERDERPTVDDLAEEVVRLEADHGARLTKERLSRFAFERSHGNVTDGASATLQALARRQATLLLIHDDVEDRRMAARGADPVNVAAEADALEAVGEREIVTGRLVDVAVGAALNSGVEVRFIPSNVPDGPAEGIGSTLRP